ncbi:Transcription factor Sp8 [Fusarium oxysporum f. sp. rapae]|uniref:Transcription factor Sp8 n=1 Tax=Fusarium oxysporum f. sp. rapae TaxID=485398 RepID=A0A8J5NZI7_FUSOX|nr:Transcription factor Sp8 [Fusarium oxysporum f. sp. rapae]
MGSWPQDIVSLGPLMDQEDVLDLVMDSAPPAVDDDFDFGFAAPIIGMDSHLSNAEAAQFDLSSSPVSLLDLPESAYESAGSVYSQSNDTVLDAFSPVVLGSEGTQIQSFGLISSDFGSPPTETSADNSSSSETSSKERFEEDAVTRLKSDEFARNGIFFCNWPKCDKSFDENRKRNNHLRTHTRPVHCSWPGCGYTDAWQKDMHRHYKTHRSRKTFQCLLCNEWFTRKCNLSRHVREAHRGKKRERKRRS